MKTFTLDARQWSDVLDFYDALLAALQAPDWHGRSFDALVDSMIIGGVNEVVPPYRVEVVGLDKAAGEIATEVKVRGPLRLCD